LGAVKLLALPSWFTADPIMMAQGESLSPQLLAIITIAQDSDLQQQAERSCVSMMSYTHQLYVTFICRLH
jgi:hypothetical protein